MKRDNNNEVGKLIAALMAEAEITQVELAARIGDGVKQHHISRWVSGEISPNAYRLIQILRELCVPLPKLTEAAEDDGPITDEVVALDIAKMKLGDPVLDELAFHLGLSRTRMRLIACGKMPMPASVLLKVLRMLPEEEWPGVIRPIASATAAGLGLPPAS